MAVRKLRAGVFGGMAMLGAGVMLSACSPVQMGAAAIVGNQRISQTTLSSNVTDLKNAVGQLSAQQARELQIGPTQYPSAVLGTLVEFQIWDRISQDSRISVTPSEVSTGKKQVKKSFGLQQAEQMVQQAQAQGVQVTQAQIQGLEKDLPELAQIWAVNHGVTPEMMTAYGRVEAQQVALAEKLNGGKPITTQAQNKKVTDEVNAAYDKGLKETSVKVNPQYGKFNPSLTTALVEPAPDTLSKPAGGTAAAAPASVSAP